MPVEFELDREARIVRSRASGAITDGELLTHVDSIRALFDDGTLDSTWAQLADLSESENFDGVTIEGVHELSERNPWPPRTLRAIVTSSDLAFGMARMYQMVSGDSGQSVHVCRSEPEARLWVSARRRESAASA